MIIKATNALTASIVVSLWMLTATAFKNPNLILSKDIANKALMDTIPGDTTVAGDKVYEAVDEEAYFPGKEDGWRSFLEQNLNPSTPVDNGAPAGTYTIYIQFVVDLNGKLSEIKPLTKHGYV